MKTHTHVAHPPVKNKQGRWKAHRHIHTYRWIKGLIDRQTDERLIAIQKEIWLIDRQIDDRLIVIQKEIQITTVTIQQY